MFWRRFPLLILTLLLLLAFNAFVAGVGLAAPPVPPTPVPVVLPPTFTPRPLTSPTATPRPRLVTPLPSLIPGLPAPTPVPQPKLISRPPAITATSAIAVDAATGKILYEKDPDHQLAMASTTKIMTAITLLSINGLDLNAETTVVPEDLVGEANMGLQAGERIKILTLLIGLLTNSANEAAMAIARYAGALQPGPLPPVDKFVAMMNAKANSLGMFQSHYSNPHGLDQAGHYTTAHDLAISGWYALHFPAIMTIVGFSRYSYGGHDFYNVNNFIRRYPGATGLKPGLTDNAGHTLVATANNYGHTVITVILNSDLMAQEVDAVMDYSFSLLNGQAEAQPVLPGQVEYVGLVSGDRLLPYDIRPLVGYFKWLAEGVGGWFARLKN